MSQDTLAQRIRYALLQGKWDEASLNPHEEQVIGVSQLGILLGDFDEKPEGWWIVLSLELVSGVDVRKLSHGWVNDGGRWKYEVSPKDTDADRARPFKEALMTLGYLDGKMTTNINPGAWSGFHPAFGQAVRSLTVRRWVGLAFGRFR